MYIPVTKSCAVRGAGGPEYKRNNATANMLLDMGDDKLQSAIQKQVQFTFNLVRSSGACTSSGAVW